MIELLPEKLFSGRMKALQNSVELHDDAKILFENKKWASSFYLVNIATEELGKYSLIVSSSIRLVHESLNWKRFWTRFRSHRKKTELLLLIENLHRSLHDPETKLFNFTENRKYASLQDDAKMKSLYCDVSNDGIFHIPKEVINESVCDLALKLFEQRLEIVKLFEKDIASKFPIQNIDKQKVENFYKEIGLSKILKNKKINP